MSEKSSRPKIQRVINNEKCGYSIIYYETEKNCLPRDPEVILHNEDNSFERWRVSHISDDLRKPKKQAEDAVRRAIADQKVEEIQKTFSNIQSYCKKTGNHDLSRKKIIPPTYRRSMRGRSADEICDILLQNVIKPKNNDYDLGEIYDEKSSQEWKNSWKRKVSQHRKDREEKRKFEKKRPWEVKKVTEEKRVYEEKKCPACTCRRNVDPNDKNAELALQREYEQLLDLFEKTCTCALRRYRNNISDLEIKYL